MNDIGLPPLREDGFELFVVLFILKLFVDPDELITLFTWSVRLVRHVPSAVQSLDTEPVVATELRRIVRKKKIFSM